MKKLTIQQAGRRFNYLTEQEYLVLGPTPINEQCIQAGYENLNDGVIECIALINQLQRQYGPAPAGAEFFILENFHDFGIYHESAIAFDCPEPEDREPGESFDYASKCELLPENWDQEALAELRTAGHVLYQPAKVIKMKVA